MTSNLFLNTIKNFCIKNNIDEDYYEIVCETLRISRTELYQKEEFDLDEIDKVTDAVLRMKEGLPLAKAINNACFMGFDFYVDERCLTPRNDTEIANAIACDFVMEKFDKLQRPIKVLDMCCGSGCMGISIKLLLKDAVDVTLCDISSDALDVAKKNAENLEASVHFVQSDMFNEIDERFDVIVSNPPYIRTDEIKDLEAKVRDYDPHIALDGGEDGLKFYRILADEAKNYLYSDGAMVCEIGGLQTKEMKKVLETAFLGVDIKKDFQGFDRALICRFLIEK